MLPPDWARMPFEHKEQYLGFYDKLPPAWHGMARGEQEQYIRGMEGFRDLTLVHREQEEALQRLRAVYAEIEAHKNDPLSEDNADKLAKDYQAIAEAAEG